MIKTEVMILWQLDHRNVVKYKETYEDKNKLYIITEFCPKQLFDIKDGPNFSEK